MVWMHLGEDSGSREERDGQTQMGGGEDLSRRQGKGDLGWGDKEKRGILLVWWFRAEEEEALH